MGFAVDATTQEVRFYFQGARTQTGAYMRMGASAAPVIGNNPAHSSGYSGLIAEVSFYDKALTDQDFTDLYNASTVAGSSAPPIIGGGGGTVLGAPGISRLVHRIY